MLRKPFCNKRRLRAYSPGWIALTTKHCQKSWKRLNLLSFKTKAPCPLFVMADIYLQKIFQRTHPAPIDWPFRVFLIQSIRSYSYNFPFHNHIATEVPWASSCAYLAPGRTLSVPLGAFGYDFMCTNFTALWGRGRGLLLLAHYLFLLFPKAH